MSAIKPTLRDAVNRLAAAADLIADGAPTADEARQRGAAAGQALQQVVRGLRAYGIRVPSETKETQK